MNVKLFDADRHVIEPLAMWRDYVDQQITQAYPIHLQHDTPQARQERIARLGDDGDVQLPPQYLIGDDIILDHWNEGLQIACALKNDKSSQNRVDAMMPETQLSSMDNESIHQAAIYPTFAPFVVNHCHLSAEVSLAYAQGYNRWLYDYCEHDNTRLHAVGVISRHAPENMVEQLQDVIKMGWSTIILRPEQIAGRMVGHPDNNAFWQACEDNNISVALHGGTHLHAKTVGSDRFDSHFALHACSHPMEMQMAFLSLLDSGVLERHPKLKFAFLEAGASWVPHWLWRLDNICHGEFPTLTAKNIKMKPSQYFKRQCWVGIEMEEPCLAETVKMIGHDKLLFGTDFPHPDHTHFELSEQSTVCQVLNTEQLQDVLYHNAVTFYGA